MTRAVYLSLELRGKISEVYIKDLEAVIRCAYRGEDISGDNLLSNADYNYALNSYGGTARPVSTTLVHRYPEERGWAHRRERHAELGQLD